MYARLTRMHFKIDRIEAVVKLYKDSVIPAAKSQKGFKKDYMFLDRETGKGYTLSIWETKEDAIANEKNLYYQEQIVKLMPFFRSNPIREGFEVEVDV